MGSLDESPARWLSSCCSSGLAGLGLFEKLVRVRVLLFFFFFFFSLISRPQSHNSRQLTCLLPLSRWLIENDVCREYAQPSSKTVITRVPLCGFHDAVT